MGQKLNIKDLVGRNLNGFTITEMTEVYFMNDDGQKSGTVGFFRRPAVAEAFVGMQSDASWHRTRQTLVLTDGIVGFVIMPQNQVNLFDDGDKELEIKKKAIEGLPPAVRRLFGFEQ